MPTELIPTAVSVAGGLLSSGGGSTQPGIPSDLRGTRSNQIDLLNYFLGFGPGPGQPQGNTGAGGQGGPARPQAPTRGYAPGTNAQNPGLGGAYGGGAAGMGGGQGGFVAPNANDVRTRIESYFGNLGVPVTGLQRQSLDAIGKYLNQPAPEQRAMDISLPALQGILNGKPGEGIINALQPSFERNLASANQQGARFGSANAILKSRAVEDFNLLGAQAAQQGIQQQLAAADALRLLGESAGNNPFQRLAVGYGIGGQEAAQNDIATQRFLQILLQQLGTAQSASLGVPSVQQPNGFANFLGGVTSTAGAYDALRQIFGTGSSGKGNIPGGTGGGGNG